MLGRADRLQAYSFRLLEKLCGEPQHDYSVPLPHSLQHGDAASLGWMLGKNVQGG